MLVKITATSTMIPGRKAAWNNVDDETPSTSPRTIYAMEGGIRIPVQAPEATKAQA